MLSLFKKIAQLRFDTLPGRLFTISLFTFILLNSTQSLAQSISKIRHYDTWNGGIIKSTDPAGIAYHKPSGHLYIADSEIDELPVFVGDNIFEVSLLGDEVFQEIESNNSEPTGITYNEFDDFFYVTNDDIQLLSRYDSNLNNPLASVKTTAAVPSATDPEGITSDPSTGLLYIADGKDGGCQVLIYDSNLIFQGSWSVDQFADPEGIAFNPDNGNLYLVSSIAMGIFEYTVSGAFVTAYDISSFSPSPISPQGLTFAPTSDPNDPPGDLAIYIADGMIDNFEDGRIYEANISSDPTIILTVTPQPGDPVIIPPQGQSLLFNYDVTVDNNSAATLNAQIWNTITLPTGEEIGPIQFTPMNINVSAFGSFNQTFLLEFPPIPPPGIYVLNMKVGTFPNIRIARDPFAMVRSSGPVPGSKVVASNAEDWELISVEDEVLPAIFVVEQNYPNPFNPATTIKYQLSGAEQVKVTVFDLRGKRIRELVDEYQVSGSHFVRWDGRDDGGRRVASGVYFYRMQAGERIESRRMTLTK